MQAKPGFQMLNNADTIVHQTIPQSEGDKKRETIIEAESSPSESVTENNDQK